jgi:TatD DNase family protein
LEMPRLYSSAAKIVERARRAGVIGIVVSPIEPKFYPKALDLTKRFPGFVWATFGLHPPQATPRLVERCVQLMREHVDQIVAIGEVGLDYYWVKDAKRREYQHHAFAEFIHLAAELDLPIVVHSREAESDAIKILRDEGVSRVQLHCFNNPDHVEDAAVQNWYMSVPTSVVTRKRMQRVASAMPLENMLLETDAPYLSPIPGQQNESSNVPQAAAKIAELKGTTLDKIAEITTENALKMLNLEQGEDGLRRR